MNSSLLFGGLSIAVLLLSVLIIILIKKNKEGINDTKNELASRAMGRGIAIGYAIGMGPGIALGVALENIGLGIALGAAIGIAIGVALGESFKKKELANAKHKRNEEVIAQMKGTSKIILLLVALVAFLLLAWLFFANIN